MGLHSAEGVINYLTLMVSYVATLALLVDLGVASCRHELAHGLLASWR